MAESQTHRSSQDLLDSVLNWAGERFVRMGVIVAMLVILAPLFTQSLAGLPEFGPFKLSEVEVALSSVVAFVIGRDVISLLLRRNGIVE